MEDLVLGLLTGAVFGLASLPVARMPKPRLFWGSAWVDPTGVSWVVGFLLFGPVSALTGSAVGTLGIWKTSPEPTPALGAALKFLGTTCLWLTVATVVTVFWDGRYPPQQLNSFQMAVGLTLLGGLVRAAVMIPLGYFYSIPYYRSHQEKRRVTRTEAVAEFGGVARYVIVLTLFNVWLSLFDLLVPWIALYPTGLAQALTM
ncbi:MAG TPA: hypothetical protein VJM51_07525 [Dehalococcoidia bacterium]|nr:hypothetical protein [Dehalococcoidia bacterium]